LIQRNDLLRPSRVVSRRRVERDAINSGAESRSAKGRPMSTILIIVVLLLLFGGGGGYYAHSRYGGAGLGGVLGTVLLIVVVIWLVGGLH
jgi:hypothetical protein